MKVIENLTRYLRAVCLLCWWAPVSLLAQEGPIPGFASMEDSVRMQEVKAYLQKPEVLANPESMKAGMQRMIDLCQQHRFRKGEAYGYGRLFRMYRMPQGEDSLVLLRDQIQERYYSYLSCPDQLRFILHVANFYGESDQADLAQKEFHAALALADSCGLSKGDPYNGLAVVNNWLGKDSLALEYLLLAAEELHIHEPEDTLGLARYYINISSLYSQLNSPDSALVYVERAMEYERSPRSLIHRARLMMLAQRWDEAQRNHDEAEELLASNKGRRADAAALYVGQSNLYRMTGQFEEAVASAQKSLEIAQKGQRMEAVVQAYALLIEAYLEDKAHLLDSMGINQARLHDRDVQQATLQEQARFKTVQKEKEILELSGQLKDQEIATLEFRNYLLYGGLAVLLLAGILYFWIRRRQSNTLRELDKLRKQAIKLQMNPHFIFNVLNSINQYIAENDQKAARYYLAKFAKLMRLTLENSQEDTILIKHEIEFLQNYLLLEQMRMQNFDFEFQVADELMDLHIPGLLIQPLVENSLLHGFSGIPYRGQLQINILKVGNQLAIEVVDNGVGKKKSQEARAKIEDGHRSFALSILHQRLANYSQQAIEVVYAAGLKVGDNTGTKVSFRFPIIQ